MATLQEMQAKRKELQSVNPYASLRDANAELKKTATPVTPANPTTPAVPKQSTAQWVANSLAEKGINFANPTTPAVTPPTTTPTTQNTVTGVNGEVFQVAPVDQTTGLSQVTPPPTPESVTTPPPTTNVTPAPVVPKTTQTPTTDKETPTIDYTTSVGREADVQKNLDSFVASGMDAEKLKIASGYESATPEKRAMIDATIAKMNTPVDQNSIYTMLSTNAPITDKVKSSPYYKQAEATYKQVQNYKTMTPDQLVTAVSTGTLLPWTDTYNKLIQDPVMAQKIIDARVYAQNPKPEEILANQSTQILSQNSKVAQALEDGVLSLDEYNSMTNNTDVVAQANLLQKKQEDLNTYNLEWNNAIEKAKKDFAGSPFLSSILADINNGYKAKGDFLQNDVTISAWTLSELKNTATTMLEANMENYKAYRNAQIGVDTKRATNTLDLQKAQADFEQKLSQQAQLAKDPQTAIQNTIDQFSKLGIISDKGIQWHMEQFAKSGQSIGDYVAKMVENYKAKPEYKKQMSLIMWQLSDSEKMNLWYAQDINKMDIANQYDLSKMSLAQKYELQKIGINNQNDLNKYLIQNGITSGVQVPPDVQNIVAISPRLSGDNVQCGMVSNDYWKSKTWTALSMGDTIQSKIDAINKVGKSETPQVWGVFAWDLWTGTGHTGIIKSVNSDGTITVVDANKKWSTNWWPVETSTYKISPKMTFSVSPTGNVWSTNTTPEAQNYFDLIQKGTTTYDDVFKKIGWTKAGQSTINQLNALISSKWWVIPALPNSPQVKQMDEDIKSLQWLVNDPDAIENISWFFQTSPIDALSGKNSDTLATIKYILEWKTLQGLIDAKAQGATFGALSNDELNLLKNSSSKLSAMARKDKEWNIIWFSWTESSVKWEMKKLLDLYVEKKNKMLNPLLTNTQADTNTSSGTVNFTSSSWKSYSY